MNASNATVVVNLHVNEPTIAGQHRPARPSWFRRTRSLTVPGARALGWIALGAWLALVPVPAARARVQIVSTLPDYAAIAQAVGGDLVQVTSLARGTEDPHFVEPLPSFVQKLNRADALLEGGADLEVGWLPTLVNGARNARILPEGPGRIVMSRHIRMLDVPTGPVDRSMGDVHPAGNPHYHLDPENGLVMAKTLAEGLSRLDPPNAARYQANLKKFNERLQAKLVEWRQALEPYKGTKVITYHKSFDYLLRRYGLELAGTIEPKPGIEPSPGHINALIPQAKAAGVRLVITEHNRPRKTPTFLAESVNAKLVLLPAMVGGAPGTSDYISFMDHVVKQLAQSLKPGKP